MMEAWQPIRHLIDGDLGCPVCGLLRTVPRTRNYDTCPRCDWVDDPAARDAPLDVSEANDRSLNEARETWPDRSIDRLSQGAVSFLSIQRDSHPRQTSGYDIFVDCAPLSDVFPSARVLKPAFGPWRDESVYDFTTFQAEHERTPTGRVPLYVCHLCGDVEFEENLSADIAFRDGRIIWSRIGLEWWDESLSTYALRTANGPIGFAFDADAYQRAIADAQSMLF